MRSRLQAYLTRERETYGSRTALRLPVFVFSFAIGLFTTVAATKTLPAKSSQEGKKKTSDLYWDPPRVDSRVPSLSATPPCSLPEVLKLSGEHARELVVHLQNFVAHEQVRYHQTERPGMAGAPTVTGTAQPIRSGPPEMSINAKFDYIVDFGNESQPLNVRETRTRLDAVDDIHLGDVLDKGLPVLALIFYPDLQSDYEFRCEGSGQWNKQPACVVYFRQMKGKRPRTMSIPTATEAHPHSSTAELRPLSLKGRAWIAAESGQVIHLETNLAEPILMIDLQELAVSVDYAPVKFQSQNVEVWLPQHAVAYIDYSGRRMIIEHTFSDFQLFSVQTQETIQKPKEP